MSYVEQNDYVSSDLGLVKISGDIGGIHWPDVTIKEIVIGESLINPGLMTSVTVQSAPYSSNSNGYKNLMDLKGKQLNLNLSNRLGRSLSISNMTVYRLDNRSMMPINLGKTEEFTFHTCHQSLLDDAQHVMSKSWKCVTPDQVVGAALDCVGSAGNRSILSCSPSRDYIAEMIHPYQVIQQQANVALDGDDPSFLHYMTHEGGGKHWFRSLKSMMTASDKQVYTFSSNEVGVLTQSDYNNPDNLNKVIVFEFPCFFDLLADLLNGVGPNGQNLNVVTTWNPSNMAASLIGGSGNMMSDGCIPATNVKQSMTNKGSGQQDYGCPTDVESHLLLRQARMGLLERDKIALRFTVPWAPDVHVGDRVQFNWFDPNRSLMPDSDSFVVSSLMHKIQFGGFSTTTFDCIRTRY